MEGGTPESIPYDEPTGILRSDGPENSLAKDIREDEIVFCSVSIWSIGSTLLGNSLSNLIEMTRRRARDYELRLDVMPKHILFLRISKLHQTPQPLSFHTKERSQCQNISFSISESTQCTNLSSLFCRFSVFPKLYHS